MCGFVDGEGTFWISIEPQPKMVDTGGQVEKTKVVETTVLKELGKLTP